MHPFEKSKLGLAPFRFVTAICMPPRSLLEQNPSAYNYAMRECMFTAKHYGVHIGTCNHCGMSLQNNFVIRSTDGKHSVLGCDCVRKTSWADAGLVKAVETANKVRLKDRAATKKRTTAAARKVAMKVKRTEFYALHKDTIAIAWTHRQASPFMRDMVRNFLRWGNLTERQLNAIVDSVGRLKLTAEYEKAEAARKAKAGHVGQPGERIERELTTVVRFTIDTAYGIGYITILRDTDGNTFKTYGKCTIDKGETKRVKFTVKAHGIYKDEKQTTIIRLKVA